MSLYNDQRAAYIAAMRLIVAPSVRADFMNALRERVHKRLDRPASDFDLLICYTSELRDAYQQIKAKHSLNDIVE